MGNSSEKIQEVIDLNLSGINRFNIQFNKQTLTFESKVEPFFDLYLLLALIPSIIGLSIDLNVWSWVLAFSWFAIFGRKYLQVISSYNTSIFNSEDKTVKVLHLNWLIRLFADKTEVTYQSINEIETSPIKFGNVYMPYDYLVSIRSQKGKIRLVILKDDFQAQRLKFVITEFLALN